MLFTFFHEIYTLDNCACSNDVGLDQNSSHIMFQVLVASKCVFVCLLKNNAATEAKVISYLCMSQTVADC